MLPLPLAVPTLNRYDLLREMLASLERSTVMPERILVLDNGGRLKERIRRDGALPLWDRTEISVVIGHGRSLAASWNTAIRWGLTDRSAVIITNDDIQWEPDSYRSLVDGLCYGEPDMGTTENVGGFVCFALTRELVEKVGEFDTRFFPAYFEDEDYRYRMKLAGVYPRSVPGARIQHVESASLQAMDSAQRELFKGYFQRNVTLYRQKWGGVVGEEQYEEPAL